MKRTSSAAEFVPGQRGSSQSHQWSAVLLIVVAWGVGTVFFESAADSDETVSVQAETTMDTAAEIFTNHTAIPDRGSV
ncbi:MAG: hypothetical protein MI861_21130 [Pirellulales bacterium]|nr:hypothetical protein [Pirellulales bacterium]